MDGPTPETAQEVVAIVREAERAGGKLEICGGGTWADVGAPREAGRLSLRRLTGIVSYDPTELVITARAGTPLAEIQALVSSERQMLAFEPWDAAPLFGRAPGAATIGGVLAAGISGPGRLAGGSARDAFLGLEAVSGDGTPFVAGGKVVKNVTGYDLPKLLAGSWGRLAVLTEVTLKVMPRPESRETFILEGLGLGEAVSAMSVALGSAAGVNAAAHLPAGDGHPARTALRLDGFTCAIDARAGLLGATLRTHGGVRRFEPGEADTFWTAVTEVSPLSDSAWLWRVVIPPTAAEQVVGAAGAGARWLADWGGGLIWIASDGDPLVLRAAAARAGGHAMLVRAPRGARASIPARQPRAPSLAALEARVRRAFDPSGLFETSRFLEG